jgi:PAS domain S-box-containing protein
LDPSAFRALVESAPDGVVVSRDGIVLYANQAAAEILGYADAAEMLGKPMTWLDRQSVEIMRQRIGRIAAGERLVPREYPARRRDSTPMTVEIASTIIDFDGKPAVLAYARDVTDRARLRAQLAHADRLASLGTMAAGVAHEINNPLTFMGLATEALARRVNPADESLVTGLRTGIERIAAIVQDLRSFGRGDDGVPAPMDLAAAIDAAERLVQHEIRPRGVLVKEYDGLPPVVGVPRRIEQVFVNLLLNAVHAFGDRNDGRIVLRATVNSERVVVVVEDDGVGVPAENLEAIFEPFFTTRAASGGTGLGLSICRDIVLRAGGDLKATSVGGRGTSMAVTLLRAPSGTAPTVDAPPALAPPPRDLLARPSRRRVLVVDDEAAIVRLLSEALEPIAHVTCETTSGRALELLLSEAQFDVVLCDVMMPGLSGIDLHERVARDRPELASKFVFMSGGTYTAHARDHLERVANPRLDKPFRVAQLLEVIERFAVDGRPA